MGHLLNAKHEVAFQVWFVWIQEASSSRGNKAQDIQVQSKQAADAGAVYAF